MKSYKEILAENQAWAKEIFEKIDKKMQKVAVRSRDIIPDGYGTDANGMHVDVIDSNPHLWTNGFWGGLNYMLYAYTKNEEYLKTAKSAELLMDRTLKNWDRLSHDMGFLWHIAAGAGYRLTGDKDSRRRNLYAASILACRFIVGANYLRAFNNWGDFDGNKDWSIIDTMMNLPILYWASEEIGDDRFKRMAMSHADMAIRNHLRPDGSIAHIVVHDRDNPDVFSIHEGGQGYSGDSSWSRGQAWGLYGFTLSYIHTGEKRYLDAAKQIANYFIANCAANDWLPLCDFRAPSEPVVYDSSAGGCACCGLIELARLLPEDEGGMYLSGALNILKAMTEKFACFDENRDELMLFGSHQYPRKTLDHVAKVHINILYSDYYYTEAILKLVGSDFLPW